MRIAICTLILMIVSPGASPGENRTWTDRKGYEIKGEFTGGVTPQGKAVLKVAGNRRIQVRLSELSLQDRDYLADVLTKRKNPKDIQLLKQMMLAENQIPVIDPDAVRPAASNSAANEQYNPDPDEGNAFNPQGNPSAANRQAPAVETEMYGLPLPSPELLVEDQVRTWTSLDKTTRLDTFERVLAPGFLRLKRADGTKETFALANFSKADIDYVKEVLEKDLARAVFPEGNGFQSLTPDDVAKGYRVWTDRKNVPLIGKFVSIKSKNVVIEVNGQEQEYPKAGLSEADRAWVDGEVKRRAEAAQQAAAARQSAANERTRSRFSPYGNTSAEGSADSTGNRFGSRPYPSFEYKFTCEHCGKTWTGPTPISYCSECRGKNHFECHRCGHKWTEKGSMLSSCPKCNATRDSTSTKNSPYNPSTRINTSSSPESFGAAASSPPAEDSGVVMTIVYVFMGLGVLGGIAVGLFKAFG